MMKKALWWIVFCCVVHKEASGWPPEQFYLKKLSDALYALATVPPKAAPLKQSDKYKKSESPSQGAFQKQPSVPQQSSPQGEPSQKSSPSKKGERKYQSTVGVDAEAFEQRLHKLINDQRVQKGRPPLKWDPQIAVAALTHTNRMVGLVGSLGRSNALSHDLPAEPELFIRLGTAGVTHFNAWAENIAYGTMAMQVTWTSGAQVVKKTVEPIDFEKATFSMVDGWMNSPGHRQNILNQNLTRGGIGVAFIIDPSNGNELVYATQDFVG